MRRLSPKTRAESVRVSNLHVLQRMKCAGEKEEVELFKTPERLPWIWEGQDLGVGLPLPLARFGGTNFA